MDLLITVVGLLVAVYAVIPRARRLDLRLRFGTFEIAVFSSGFFAILYLDLYSFFKAKHLTVPRPAWFNGLTTVQVTHVLVVILLVTLVLRSQLARLTPAKIFRFQDLAEELLWSESYAQLLTVMETHLGRLFTIYHADFWPQRLRRTYSPRSTLEALHQLIEHPPTAGQKLIGGVVRRFEFLLPQNERWQLAASELVPKILLSKGFVATIARSRPYFGLEIILHLRETSDGFLREEFFELYIEELMSHRASVFYAELANSRNGNGHHRYVIRRDSRLLTFLFVDAAVAHELEVYRPVGEFILRELDHLAHRSEDDPYNRAYTDRRSHGSELSLSAAIHFFAVMVSEALYQDVAWHMWLYYVTYVTKSVLRNYKPFDDPLVRLDAEFPIGYSFLLYEIFSSLRDWILAIEDVPDTQENVHLRATAVTHENGNIPKSAILALGDCVQQVLLCDKLNEKLKETLMSVVFGIYFDLRSSTKFGRYAEALRNAIASGGFARRESDNEYRQQLRYFLEKQDRFRFNNFIEELESAFA